jgi:hypothetical protein
LAVSVFVSTQAVPQRVRPVGQTAWQTPPEQVRPEGQAFPQTPQFFGSVAVSVQIVVEPDVQYCLGDAQTQAEPVHDSPVRQAWEQAPQS